MMMNKISVVLTALAIAASGMVAQGQNTSATTNDAQKAQSVQAAGPVEPSKLYEKAVAGVEKEFVSLAEAMPADKYDFAPTQGEFKGVRTFGEQVKHVAQANMSFYGAVLGEKPPANEDSDMSSIKTKDQIVDLLKKSFEMGHRAAQSITAANAFQTVSSPFGPPASRAGLMTIGVAHAFDHYGQMVVYGRMNGIVPPASQKR